MAGRLYLVHTTKKEKTKGLIVQPQHRDSTMTTEINGQCGQNVSNYIVELMLVALAIYGGESIALYE